MKIRSDFVSNSSSSSFVVLADENTPKVFKDELLTFEEFCRQFFRRDTVDELEYGIMSYSRNKDKIFDKIIFVTPGEFLAEYVKLDGGSNNFSKAYYILESDRELVDVLRALVKKSEKFDGPNVKVYRRGKPDFELERKVKMAVYDMQQRVYDEIQGVLNKISDHFLNVARDKMSDWKFWYAELDDDQESSGYDALDSVKWGRVFSNH